MIDDEQRYKIDRALNSLQSELRSLEGMSQSLTLKVRASQETAERLRRMALELQSITPDEESRD